MFLSKKNFLNVCLPIYGKPAAGRGINVRWGLQGDKMHLNKIKLRLWKCITNEAHTKYQSVAFFPSLQFHLNLNSTGILQSYLLYCGDHN